MMMAPEADTADGQLDVIFANEMGRIDLLKTFPQIFRGTHLGHRAVEAARARVVEFDVAEEAVLVVDGEVLCYTPLRMQVLPGALQVRV